MDVIRPFMNLPEIKREDINKNISLYAHIRNVFNDEEINRILKLWNEDVAAEAKINDGKNNYLQADMRKSNIIFLDPQENAWIHDKLAMACILTNANKYKFDITGFHTRLKMAEYKPGDFFEWHMDYGSGRISTRKLSFSVQLSDEHEYEGGDLQFLAASQPVNAPKEKGTIIIFPSFVTHRVTPVSSGVRKAIIGHIAGPSYR